MGRLSTNPTREATACRDSPSVRSVSRRVERSDPFGRDRWRASRASILVLRRRDSRPMPTSARCSRPCTLDPELGSHGSPELLPDAGVHYTVLVEAVNGSLALRPVGPECRLPMRRARTGARRYVAIVASAARRRGDRRHGGRRRGPWCSGARVAVGTNGGTARTAARIVPRRPVVTGPVTRAVELEGTRVGPCRKPVRRACVCSSCSIWTGTPPDVVSAAMPPRSVGS